MCSLSSPLEYLSLPPLSGFRGLRARFTHHHTLHGFQAARQQQPAPPNLCFLWIHYIAWWLFYLGLLFMTLGVSWSAFQNRMHVWRNAHVPQVPSGMRFLLRERDQFLARFYYGSVHQQVPVYLQAMYVLWTQRLFVTLMQKHSSLWDVSIGPSQWQISGCP